MRINKFIADSGVCSRRAADQYIKDGRVKVNGKTVDKLGMDINEEKDKVVVDGKPVNVHAQYTYIIFNKPKGCVCTVSDEHDRKTIFDYVPNNERLFPVGRLDYDTEGLLIITNDGELAYKLTHPSREIPKTYTAKIEGEIEESSLARLRNGVMIDGTKTKKASVKFIDYVRGVTTIQITVSEGRNRQIRRMFEAIGREVVFLKRIAIGDLKLRGLSRGEWRKLNVEEIFYLKNF